MSRPRTPQQIARDMHEIRDLLPIVLKAYNEVHDFGYSAGGMPGTEAVGSSGIANSDPTGQAAVAGAKQYAVRQMMAVGRELDAAVNALRSSQTTLERAWPRDRDQMASKGLTRHDGLTASELRESISHCSCGGKGFSTIAGERIECPLCSTARAQLARIEGWRARRFKATS